MADTDAPWLCPAQTITFACSEIPKRFICFGKSCYLEDLRSLLELNLAELLSLVSPLGDLHGKSGASLVRLLRLSALWPQAPLLPTTQHRQDMAATL